MSSACTHSLREDLVKTLRLLAVDAVERAGSGHPGAPMGLATAAVELWDHHLRFDPRDPEWPLRDRFVLSAGHASMLLYGLLSLFGFDLPRKELRSFRQLGSRTPGHPEYGLTPGVETTTGPLGQGFANGVGMALAARMVAARFCRGGEGPGQHFIYGIVSDGDLMEGISAEAASLAGHLRLGNLIYLYDDNRVTIDGSIALSWSEDVDARFAAQGWQVLRVDGEDHDALARVLELARGEAERPSLIAVRTTIGYGSPNLAGSAATHGAPLGADEVRATKLALGWPLAEDFHVPAAVAAYCVRRATEKRKERGLLDTRFSAWERAYPDLAAAYRSHRQQCVPEDLTDLLVREASDAAGASRAHSGAALQRAAAVLPFLVGGSADLADSNQSRIRGAADVGPLAGQGLAAYAGRNIHFGVREHAMGGIVNGLALDGSFLPYAATFLVFSDYLRPALRLAAMMRLRVLYLFSHDSIFLGEDGPTHQPIEHLDALRAIPGLTVFRPADGLETAGAWAWALTQAAGPVALCLSRQKLPSLQRAASAKPEAGGGGAYALVEPPQPPQVILVATGSEVALACAVAEQLAAADGLAVRVVSAPCLELFAAQPAGVREELLPADGTPIVAIEAARGESLRPWVGPRGLICGLDGFGTSAPAHDLARHFGFTPDQIADRVRRHLGASRQARAPGSPHAPSAAAGPADSRSANAPGRRPP